MVQFARNCDFLSLTSRKKNFFKAKRKGDRRVAQTLENCHHDDDTTFLSLARTHIQRRNPNEFIRLSVQGQWGGD